MMEGKEEKRKEVECIHSNLKTITSKEILASIALCPVPDFLRHFLDLLRQCKDQ